jgi:hypothetical protein
LRKQKTLLESLSVFFVVLLSIIGFAGWKRAKSEWYRRGSWGSGEEMGQFWREWYLPQCRRDSYVVVFCSSVRRAYEALFATSFIVRYNNHNFIMFCRKIKISLRHGIFCKRAKISVTPSTYCHYSKVVVPMQ